MILIDLTGETFGRLTVVGRASTSSLHPKWVCRCVCGSERIVSGSSLRLKKTRSCGCYRKERTSQIKAVHSRSHSREWATWRAMKDRCLKPQCKKYNNYGGRGITVCDRWMKFINFYADMGDRPDGTTLDRIDVNEGYCKENCRWATHAEQCMNKTNTVKLTLNGVTKPLLDWSEELGIKKATLYRRVSDGWTDERVLTYGRL